MTREVIGSRGESTTVVVLINRYDLKLLSKYLFLYP